MILIGFRSLEFSFNTHIPQRIFKIVTLVEVNVCDTESLCVYLTLDEAD